MGVRCSENPVSLQSKHGLAYNLDGSGVGCLCKMFMSKSKGEERESCKRGERKNEVRKESEVN